MPVKPDSAADKKDKIIKLNPVMKDYLWGGTNLKTKWGKKSTLGIVAESWELSVHKDGKSTVDGGIYDKRPFADIINAGMLGTNCKKFDRFPILVKFIDAKEKLSVQVHPDDAYALKNENDLGKTEMWYIADCKKGAGIYLGFNKDTSREEVSKAVAENTVESLINFIPVNKGESYLISAGTVHAIGKGLTICEIQQNSNVTYRVYDYNRTGADGKKRQLHTEKALDVLNYAKYEYDGSAENNGTLASCGYFCVKKFECADALSLFCGDESFNAVVITEGRGLIDGRAFKKGDTFFVPAGYGEYTVKGKCGLLYIYV